MKRVFKTKKKLSGVKTQYRAWKEWDEGDQIVAKLIGSAPNKMNEDKTDWIVHVEEAFFSDLKDVKRVKGKTLTLNTAGQLDKGMAQVEMGDLVQVTYNGEKTMEGGKYAGKKAHTMEVELVVEDDGESDDEDAEDEDMEDEEDEEDL